MKPTVVIAIPTRNSEPTLVATLESALSQTYDVSKILVVDNDSSDATTAVAAVFAAKEARIEVIKFHELVPGEENFNRCLHLAGDSKYVAILHSDDIYTSEMIGRQVEFLESHPESVAVFTHAKTIDEAGMETGERFLPDELAGAAASELDSENLFRLILKYGNFLTCPSALMRTSVFRDQLKGWQGAEFGSSADLDLWLRASNVGRIGFLSKPLMNYRVSRWSYSVALSKVRVSAHPMLKVIASHVERRQASGKLPLEASDLWNWGFLQMKDAAFLKLNRLKLGSASADPCGPQPQFNLATFMKALIRSRFHRRFAIRMAAIELMNFLGRVPGLRTPVKALVSRIKVQ